MQYDRFRKAEKSTLIPDP